MNRLPVHLLTYSLINDTGIETDAGVQPWEPDQNGPGDIRRAQVLPKPYIAFGKLNLPDKLAFSAASLLLSDRTGLPSETTGVVLGIPFGSLSTDRLYRESVKQGNPSPALFSATLPSSPIADVAIYYKLKGPNTVFSGGDSPLLSAIEYSRMLLETGILTDALVLLVDEPCDPASGQPLPAPFAAALLLSTRREFSLYAPTMVFSSAEKQDTPLDEYSSDRDLIVTLIQELRKKESVRIPVPASGFKGYISLHYPRKDY